MPTPDFRQLVQQLVASDLHISQAARNTLLAMDEDAIDPLIDQFYAGVSDEQGVAILDIMAEIGGPDALSSLRNVFYFEDSRPILQHCAARGLLHNIINLDQRELDDVRHFLASGNDSKEAD